MNRLYCNIIYFRKRYGRREIRVREAGDKGTGGGKIRVREAGDKGTGGGR